MQARMQCESIWAELKLEIFFGLVLKGFGLASKPWLSGQAAKKQFSKPCIAWGPF